MYQIGMDLYLTFCKPCCKHLLSKHNASPSRNKRFEQVWCVIEQLASCYCLTLLVFNKCHGLERYYAIADLLHIYYVRTSSTKCHREQTAVPRSTILYDNFHSNRQCSWSSFSRSKFKSSTLRCSFIYDYPAMVTDGANIAVSYLCAAATLLLPTDMMSHMAFRFGIFTFELG